MLTRPKPLDNERHVVDNKSIMCKTDSNKIIEYANEYFVELTSYDEGEIMGESLDLLIHPDMPKTLIDFVWYRVNNKQKTSAIFKFLSKQGNYFWLQIKFDFKVSEVTREISNIYLYAIPPSRMGVINLSKFYNNITKIEKNSSIDIAKNYFEGYLENSKQSYESFIEQYLKIA